MSRNEDEPRDAAELSYRRGYHHAAGEALAAVQAGANAEDLERWCAAVNEWQEAPDGATPAPALEVPVPRDWQGTREAWDDLRRGLVAEGRAGADDFKAAEREWRRMVAACRPGGPKEGGADVP